ncbi:hypothetical protein EJ05DRAFT_536772 [Pseudovirgaria hyperparasitica]|uniref:Uncharacterized protein n=1 Tax=Pseudovirgaria hyperparasitica TaxID=470096 RepID=A0A6A6WBP6_9PEZI|nr:uncharacterized protein EJ05DRAFT_536772 [Pseudovirgaria hyperparasitica]KAF2759464.1 hypothetical protein EJ05DRAFT_536772 [Pseudovirgaria hyperparasitica]
MATDMDIDMEIDLGPDPEIAAQEAEAEIMQHGSAGTTTMGNDDMMEAELVPEKVHIRGLDNLSTADIRRFSDEHFPTEYFVKVEWIDDTSANIIYAEPEVARDALVAFTSSGSAASLPSVQLRPAKLLSSHPDTKLHVRQAISTDIKARGARDASRYYLMNPDQDPRERKRQERENGDYKRNRFDDREHRRRQRGTRIDTDASMYDDDTGTTSVPDRRRRSRTRSFDSSDDRQRKRVRFDRGRGAGDLFASRIAGRGDGRLRNRSASPSRDGDGRLGFVEETLIRSRIRRRSLTPPAASRRHGQDTDLLAPLHGRPTVLTGTPQRADANGGIELFPERAVSSSKKAKELFPGKLVHGNHRRSDAFDANDETSENGEKVRDLFDRINSPASGRLKGSNAPVRAPDFSNGPSDQGLSIKGASQKDSVHGFYIKGAAGNSGGAVRELFPMKSGSQDLFAEKLKGRGGPRKRAEDMFS